ncbi:hypothetical protein LSUCC0387_05625 [Rhodobacterales bacterium LSUCC0387]|nr:hypothetical protein [Rhodobacterales bacterium LSUCC0387]
MNKVFDQISNFNVERKATNVECFFLAVVLLSLPISEALKNVGSLCFIISFIVQSIRLCSFGRNNPFEVPLLGLILVLWVAPLTSEYGGIVVPLSSAHRWTLIGLLALISSRLGYSAPQIKILFAAVLVGGVFAVLESFHSWLLNDRTYPEFRSVGHVNHSSMYALIPLAVGLSFLALHSFSLRILGFVAVASCLAYVPPARSFVGLAAAFWVIVAAASIYAWISYQARVLVAAGIFLTALVIAFLISPIGEGFRSEAEHLLSTGELLSGRDKIFNSAVEVWDRNPIFGTGLRSFGIATAENVVRAEVEADGRNYEALKSNYWFYGHGHNLWMTILIERGLFGIFMLAWLLISYFRTFVPLAVRRNNVVTPLERSAAVSASLVALGFFISGLGNTTMINEHGMAGMAVIAISWGFLRENGSFDQTNKNI